MSALFDRVRAGIAALVVLVAVPACSGAEPGARPGQAVPDGQLTVALEFAPKAGFAIDTDDAFVLSKLGVTETLVTPAADGTVAPRLATGRGLTVPVPRARYTAQPVNGHVWTSS